jgi:hypothetical protein
VRDAFVWHAKAPELRDDVVGQEGEKENSRFWSSRLRKWLERRSNTGSSMMMREKDSMVLMWLRGILRLGAQLSFCRGDWFALSSKGFDSRVARVPAKYMSSCHRVEPRIQDLRLFRCVSSSTLDAREITIRN